MTRTSQQECRGILELTDMKNFDAMNAVYEQQFSAPYPTRTTVGVTGLCGDALIEIELIAKK